MKKLKIKASNLILGIRQKLNDKEPDRYKFSTPEVVDSINLALANISSDLLFFNRTWKIPCNKKKSRYALPNDFVKLIRVKLNGKEIDEIRSLDSQRISSPAVSIDNVSIRVHGIHNDGDVLEMEYYYIEHINNGNSVIDMSMLLFEPIVLYATSNLFLNPVFKDGLQKSAFYNNAFLQKMKDVKDRLKSNTQTKKIKSQFRRV